MSCIEHVSGGLVPGKRSAVGVGHVVGCADAEQFAAVAAGADPRQPVAERLARRARAGRQAAAEQFAEREGAGPALGQQHHSVPSMLPGQAEYEVRRGKIGGGDLSAAVTGHVEAPGRHGRDHLGGRPLAAGEQPGRRTRKLREPVPTTWPVP